MANSFHFKQHLTPVQPTSTSKSPSVISLDYHPVASKSSTNLEDRLSTSRLSNKASSQEQRFCSVTQMLFAYATSNDALTNALNVLELHFNAYADAKSQIYFEGLFQILDDFKEDLPELVLIETMQQLQMDPFAPFNFERFIDILCHLPRSSQDHHAYLDVFHELDQNKDSFISFDDIRSVLPHLTTHFHEDVIRAALHTIHGDRLSYFDFVTSQRALQECQLTITNKGI